MPHIDDPRDIHLSRHFRLSDFLGNHSVYARGLPNPFEFDGTEDVKLANAQALCREALEPMLDEYGPLSVAYGYISPEFSRETVKYQDPNKPSHHRWDLGAAADVVVHRWLQGMHDGQEGDENTRTSPALLAHDLAEFVPYSRLITYSESPCVCIAVSAAEVARSSPRRAFYENRYLGRPGKPQYIQQPTDRQRAAVKSELLRSGLPHDWFGNGYPTHHGGGIQQYQHMRVSKYTMVSDWLFNLSTISNGEKNLPSLTRPEVQDAFAASGILYDTLIDRAGLLRLSVLQGYTSHMHSESADFSDWRQEEIEIEIAYGEGPEDQDRLIYDCRQALPGYVEVRDTERGALLCFNVFRVLEDQDLL